MVTNREEEGAAPMSFSRPKAAKHLLSRRHFLLCSALAAGKCLLPGAAFASISLPSVAEKTLAFHNLHTLEDLEVVYWRYGSYLPGALQEIDYMFRDRRTEEIHTIAPALLDVLHTLKHRLKTDVPFGLVCGYRSPKTNAMLRKRSKGVAKRSLHLKGMAVDIRVPGYRTAALRDAAMSLKAGGVGYYPRSRFVHVDIGPVRYW
jgi:uncharacterized protein YcbK (DUF882 family)